MIHEVKRKRSGSLMHDEVREYVQDHGCWRVPARESLEAVGQ